MSWASNSPQCVPIASFIFKVASRCNLNCSYCYVYNQGDTTWKSRPKIMSIAVFDRALDRIATHCAGSGQASVAICFHGGEPCLVGPSLFDAYCRQATAKLAKWHLRLSIQTNATLINEAWVNVLRRHRVAVGVSIDGPREINDLERVDHRGGGSFDRTVAGIERLRDAGIPLTALCVIRIGADSLAVHNGLLGLGFSTLNYLLPDLAIARVSRLQQQYGPTPCADFLLPIFDSWWSAPSNSPDILIFRQIAKLILGGTSSLDTLGGGPLSFLFIEADGDIESLDVLRVCENGLARAGSNVWSTEFATAIPVGSLHWSILRGEVELPLVCQSCPEAGTCGGGYLPHRFRPGSGFNNASYWCADILKLFGHIRRCLGVDPRETDVRRRVLGEMRRAALATDPLDNNSGLDPAGWMDLSSST
jgi:uncharacterized protein